MPDIAIRTTLITGFPGETQEQFEEMCAFIEESRFERLGVFAYSPEEDTPAAILDDQIDEEEKEARKDELMAIQQEISTEKSDQLVGQKMRVIVDGIIPGEGDQVSGTKIYQTRTFRDAPDIDGFLFMTSTENHLSGDYAYVKVTGSYEYDLLGEEIGE